MTRPDPARGSTTAGEILTQTAAALVAGGIGNARREARVLVAIALQAEPLAMLTAPERILSEAEAVRVQEALARRLAGEPASRIRGQREFWSLDFAVAPGVLDPRPETELLVELALGHAERLKARRGAEPLRLLDLGTGSGCILLSLLQELPDSTGIGLDVSPVALAVARANARQLGLESRASWVCGEWFGPLTGEFDLIVSNPPYIPAGHVATLERGVRNFDPPMALDGGPDGLAAYRRILPHLSTFLRVSGGAFLEVGAGQAGMVAAMARRHGMRAQISRDLAGIPRAVGLLTEF
jgi:release factor glutamine methyltransferase